jgi:phosphoribosylaminoimidazole-succinocarboxamide synthase
MASAGDFARADYGEVLAAALAAAAAGHTLEATALRVGRRFVGKVRDVYTAGDFTLIVTTDRQSAFDRLLACVPFKGQVLNLVSAFWFEATRHIVANHLVAVPHPALLVARRCRPFLVEIVVRAYLTGSTSTSIWTHYAAGSRSYCGHALREGMRKNEQLPQVLLTPSTKDDLHDRPLAPAEVVALGLMTQAEWDFVAQRALALFAFGQAQAARRGLILVDSKLEFGRDARTGEIMLIDEVFTPDSSRYWLAGSYAARFAEGREPENIDKEFLRLWFRDHCDPYKDAVLPAAPPELVGELSKRYIQLYETITGRRFELPAAGAVIGPAPLGAEVAAAAAGFFPPAALALRIFTDATAPEGGAAGGNGAAGGAAAAALDGALNAQGYAAAPPVSTRVALEDAPISVFGAPAAAAAACRAAASPAATAAVVAADGPLAEAVAVFVAAQSGLPTALVRSAAVAASHGPAPAGFVEGPAAAIAKLLLAGR